VQALFHVKINVQMVRPSTQPEGKTNEEKIEQNLEEPSLEKPSAQVPRLGVDQIPVVMRPEASAASSAPMAVPVAEPTVRVISAKTGQAIQSDDELVGPTRAASVPKVDRNEPCPCGSGEKYKRCCGQFLA
jgi:preprotein translocase subunit SecA